MHEMLPGLWQGNINDGLTADVDVVLTCSLEGEVTALRPRPLHILFAFGDEAMLPDMEYAESIAGLLAHEVALGRRVLIHCSAGKNRSGLMMGLVLRRMGIARGQALVDYIQTRNPLAFTAPGAGGPFFATYLATS